MGLRRGLGTQAWRVRRRDHTVLLDLTGAVFDLTDLRAGARSDKVSTMDELDADEIADRLRRPILTGWLYDEWVLGQQRLNDQLAAPIGLERHQPVIDLINHVTVRDGTAEGQARTGCHRPRWVGSGSMPWPNQPVTPVTAVPRPSGPRR